MVHLEVTGKESRGLCITNGDRDMHSEALRNLDKGLSKHVRNLIHSLFLNHIFQHSVVVSASPAVTVLFP